MTINPKIYTFPAIPIERQLFHVPGSAFDGGLTSGGVQFLTPEPGGLSVLEIEPSLNNDNWIDPTASWIMSKTNGQIFRVRLSATPQLAWSRTRNSRIDHDWRNFPHPNKTNASAIFSAASLKGSTQVTVNLASFGKILRPGHVIGHAFDCYLIDEISYAGNVATATVTPPLRRNVTPGDACEFRPWFTGRISNGADFKVPYDHLGMVKMGNIILNEAIIP